MALIKWYAPTAETTNAVVKYEASNICTKRYGNDGLKIIANQSSGINCPTSLIEYPAGVCIQLFTDSIQKAERKVPNATTQVEAKCSFLPTRCIPNNITPRNPASKKNAVKISYPINGPRIGPVLSENTLQFVPN